MHKFNILGILNYRTVTYPDQIIYNYSSYNDIRSVKANPVGIPQVIS